MNTVTAPTVSEAGPATASDMLAIYAKVHFIRAAEEAVAKKLRTGALGFSFYPITGQELAPSVLAHLMRPDDQLVTIYRGFADCLAKGLPLFDLLAEYAGNVAGVCKGLGGNMGISLPSIGLMLSTGIVGSGAPAANGLALAAQMQGSGKVVAVSFGDGATSIGGVHEAMNLASLWKLPVIFLCHNNSWAEATPYEEYATIERLADRAAAYGMAGVHVDGSDPLAVREALADALDRARRGDGPTFVESKTYRLTGHYFADAAGYMDAARLAEEKTRDPVPRFRALLAAQGVEEAAIAALEGSNLAQVEGDMDRLAEALATVHEATAAELHAHVYAQPDFTPISRAPRPAVTSTGATKKGSMKDALNEALAIALEQDDKVILLGEDIADPAGGILGVTKGLSDRFGRDRVRATPIAEQAIFGAAVGSAIGGMRPVGELMFLDFLPIAMDQIVNHGVKARFMSAGQIHCPMTVMTMIGQGNGAQHSQSVEAWLMHTPGIKLAYPSNPADAKGLLLSAIFDDDPCVIIESMPLLFASGEIPIGDYRVPLGVAAIPREGSDVTLIAYGPTVADALAAAKSLAEKGIDAEVIDLRTLLPLDGTTILESVRKTGRAVIAHRASEFMGASAEIAALIHNDLFGQLKAPVKRVAGTFTPVPKSATLLAVHYQGVAAIEAAVMETM